MFCVALCAAALFLVVALLSARRRIINGELGGSPKHKWSSAGLLSFLFLIIVSASSAWMALAGTSSIDSVDIAGITSVIIGALFNIAFLLVSLYDFIDGNW